VLGAVVNALPYLLVAAEVVVFAAAVVAGEFNSHAEEVTVGALHPTTRRRRRSQSLIMTQWPRSSLIAGNASTLVSKTSPHRLHRPDRSRQQQLRPHARPQS